MDKCKECGEEVSSSIRFCPNCGVENPVMSKCRKCGKEVSPSMQFCPHCGAESPLKQSGIWKRELGLRHLMLTIFGLFLALFVVGSIAECSMTPEERAERAERRATEETRQAKQEAKQEAARKVREKALALISSVEEEKMRPFKRSLTVRLREPVDKKTLGIMANHLHRQAPNFERTFIGYLLPGMRDGEGAWATTHFNPNLKVEILGATKQQLAKAVNSAKNPNVIGVWGKGIYGTHTIYKEGGRIYVTVRFSDGSKMKKELREAKASRGIRYNHVERSPTGDYYVLKRNGKLELRDNYSGIVVLQPIKGEN